MTDRPASLSDDEITTTWRSAGLASRLVDDTDDTSDTTDPPDPSDDGDDTGDDS